MFKAIWINKDEKGYRADLAELDETTLPAGEVLVKVL